MSCPFGFVLFFLMSFLSFVVWFENGHLYFVLFCFDFIYMCVMYVCMRVVLVGGQCWCLL